MHDSHSGDETARISSQSGQEVDLRNALLASQRRSVVVIPERHGDEHELERGECLKHSKHRHHGDASCELKLAVSAPAVLRRQYRGGRDRRIDNHTFYGCSTNIFH